MKSTVVVYILLAIAFVVFLTYGPSHNNSKSSHVHRRNGGHGRRLVLRASNSNHSGTSFDPIVADLEQRREDRVREHEYIKKHHPELLLNSSSLEGDEADDFDDEEWNAETGDYLNDEERFNITERLRVLFPLVDVNPADGFIGLAELEEWHVQLAVNKLFHRTDRELENGDTNKDGLITLKEHLHHMTDEELANNSTEHGEAGWWKEQFDCADEDGDGALNRTEFFSFLHPEDSKNEKILQWLCKEKIRERDEDQDGKLNFAEFDRGAYEIIKHYDEYETMARDNTQSVPSSKEMFAQLDKNNDGFLTANELGSVLHKLHPGEISYAKYHAQYQMDQADENKDKRLTLEEILANPYAFYNTAYGDEDEDDDYSHDEFR